MNLDVFLLLPSTWSADLITLIAIKFNGVNLPGEVITAFESFLGFPALINFGLLVVFLFGVFGIGIVTADRLFNFGSAGGRSTVTTVGPDNLLFRGLRRFIPGAFGVLVVTALKDFTRKVQNLSRFAYGIIVAIVAPVMQDYIAGVPIFVVVFQVAMMMGIMGGITFGGIGFMDAQDQLWIIKGAPKGVGKFVKARLVEAFLFSIPMALIPSTIVAIITGMASQYWIVLLVTTYSVICASAMIGTGITANNPTYDDTKSGSFGANTGMTVITIIAVIMVSLFATIKVEQMFGSLALMTLTLNLPIILVGVIVCFIGTKRLARSENV